MADRFHFNPHTGRTGKCAAQIECRFGQSDDQHGASREEARANYEKTMESELFSNTVSKDSDPDRPMDWDELSDLKDSFRKMHFRSDNTVYHLWASEEARSAAIRGELESRGIDSSRFSQRELLGNQFYVLSESGDRITRVTNNLEEAESYSWGPRAPLTRQDLQEAGDRRVREAVPGDTFAIARMAEILDDERQRVYPVPAKPLNRYSEAQLEEESRNFEQSYSYSVAEMLAMRNVDEREIEEAEIEFGGRVTVKIPGESEVSISAELARRELSKAEAMARRSGTGLRYPW